MWSCVLVVAPEGKAKLHADFRLTVWISSSARRWKQKSGKGRRRKQSPFSAPAVRQKKQYLQQNTAYEDDRRRTARSTVLLSRRGGRKLSARSRSALRIHRSTSTTPHLEIGRACRARVFDWEGLSPWARAELRIKVVLIKIVLIKINSTTLLIHSQSKSGRAQQ